MGIGTKKVCHISFVVKDIDKTVENWAAFLGIDMPRIWNIPKPEEAPALTDGKLEDYSDCRISVIEMDNLVLEFVQPGERTSPWKTWMEKNGEGFQHMAFVVEDRKRQNSSLGMIWCRWLVPYRLLSGRSICVL